MGEKVKKLPKSKEAKVEENFKFTPANAEFLLTILPSIPLRTISYSQYTQIKGLTDKLGVVMEAYRKKVDEILKSHGLTAVNPSSLETDAEKEAYKELVKEYNTDTGITSDETRIFTPEEFEGVFPALSETGVSLPQMAGIEYLLIKK